MPSPTVTTPVIDYHHLRLLAEWASSLRGREVGFAVREGALWQVSAAPGDAPALGVPALTEGRYGAVRALTLAAQGVPGPLELTRYGVDALFWSESAVEKFLVPYYASCAGPRAAQVLGALFDAWNGDHGGVQAVTLAHLGHATADAPLALADTLGVVFRDEAAGDAEPALRLLPLGAFRRRHPETWTPRAAPRREPVELGARILPDDARLPAYADLRGLAEWGSALRGQTAYLAYDPQPPGPEAHREGRCSRIDAPESAPTRAIVFPVHTSAEVPGRPRPGSVLLEPEQGEPVDLLRDPFCDALFTSTGAIEQFLFPYYASVRGVLALNELRQIYDAWADPREQRATADELVAVDEPEPAALVHLPQSDWDSTGGAGFEAGSPLDQVGVVTEGSRPLLTVRRWVARRRG